MGEPGKGKTPGHKKIGRAGARFKNRAPRSPGYPATGEHARVSSFQDQPDRIAVSMLTHLRAAARRLLPHGEVVLFYRIRPRLSRGERGRGKRRNTVRGDVRKAATPGRRPRRGAASHRRAKAFSRIGARAKRFFAHEWGAYILFTETMSAFLDIRGAAVIQ